MKSLFKFLGVVFVLLCVAVVVFHDKKTRAEAAAASDPLEIFYMYHEDESQAVWLRDCAEKFKALHPGLQIEILFAGRDVLQKLRPRILMGNPPDIIEQGGDQLRPLMEVGLFEPLDDALEAPAYGSSEKWKDIFLPGVLDIYRYKADDEEILKRGTLYQIPSSLFCNVFFYNVQQFDKLGLKAPRTWSEFLNVCQVLKDNGIEPIAQDGTEQSYNISWMFAMESRTTTIQHIRDTAYAKPGTSWTEECFVDAARHVQELRDKGYLMVGYEGSKWPSAQMQWAQGKCGLLLNGTWIPKEMKNKLPPGFKMGIFRFPIVDGYPEADGMAQDLGADTFAVLKGARHKEMAIEFLRFITAREQAMEIAKAEVPSATKGVPMPASLAGMEEVLGPPHRLCESYGITNDLASWYRQCARNEWNDVFLGNIKPEEMCARIQANQERFYARMKLLGKDEVREKYLRREAEGK